MSRLTKKNNDNTYDVLLEKQIEANFKLGELEDLMEKYEIESVEKLEEILKDYDEIAKDIVEMVLGVKVDFKE